MKNKFIPAALALIALSSPSMAKNTAEDWKWLSTYYKTYGEWTTACEDRADDPNIKRCYLRYVDAYARDPFGAFFVFVTITDEGPSFSFEFERGTDFKTDWVVKQADKTLWRFNPSDCPVFGDCVIGTQQSTSLAKTLAAPDASLEFSFVDGEDRAFDRSWPGDQLFADAFSDLQKQTADRQ